MILAFSFAPRAHAQSDTTPPAVTINGDADDPTSFTRLPTPLSGTLFEAGGMGYLLVRLERQHSAQVERWNGTQWTSGDFTFAASLAVTGTPGQFSWSVNANWPGGANLPTGAYNWRVSAYDAAGNGAQWVQTITIGAPDSTPPQIAISEPAPGNLLDSSQQTWQSVSGTASDGSGSGVGRVMVKLSHAFGEQTRYWDGCAWGDWFLLPATLGAPDAQGQRAWSLNGNLPNGVQLPVGRYLVQVSVYDRNGNAGAADVMLNVAPRDTVAPLVEVTFPATNQILYRLPEVRGTSQDSISGVTRVEVKLRRTMSNGAGGSFFQFWNGVSWQANDSPACLLPTRTETGWTRNQNLPTGTNLPPGAYTVLAQAVDHYYNVSAVVTRDFFIVPVPPLTIDAQIRASSDGAWLGQNLVNTTGQGQTLERAIHGGATQSADVKVVLSGGDSSKTVRLSVADWASFAASDWSARFFDASGTDITAQLTSAGGYEVALSDGDARTIRIEVSAPANIAAGATQSLTLRATTDPTSEVPPVDVVKATWNVVATAQPDVLISRLDEGTPVGWTGEGQLSPTQQQLEVVVGADEVQNFAVQIQNTSQNAASFDLKVAPLPAEWSVKFYDALEGGHLLGNGAESIATAMIEPGQSVTWRAEVTAQSPATQATLPIRVSGGSLFDEVAISAALQSLAGLQWSRDGQTWTNVTAQTLLQIEQDATIGVRGVKALPALPWPDSQPMGPSWSWQNAQLEGETVWLQGKNVTPATGETAAATLGDALPVAIRVLPEYEISLGASRRDVMAGAGPQSLKTTTISARVTTDSNAPLGNQRVRLRALHENDALAGSWQNNQSAPELLTDSDGKISLEWTSDAVAGEVRFEATLLADSASGTDRATHLSLNLNAPYTRLETGEWTEDATGWTREIRVSTWFGSNKIGGVPIALSSQVLDYETEAPVAGWQSAAPFDVAAGVSDANGNFVTVQKWNPLEADAWPHDYEVTAQGTLNSPQV